ncbi:hypothetical protein PGTUg99_034389 [Puccinia graminis f. sp. tritici]|uniref:Uncharacterized protein n=1 Tax=Puccinia graminis f. sp. tritici TaxID=56615 RepID=A0A5B0P6L0_PUCGR|nr:hypothetical protein PGTUg99_034389 [Puccinia graminis f. sp. tritici]
MSNLGATPTPPTWNVGNVGRVGPTYARPIVHINSRRSARNYLPLQDGTSRGSNYGPFTGSSSPDYNYAATATYLVKKRAAALAIPDGKQQKSTYSGFAQMGIQLGGHIIVCGSPNCIPTNHFITSEGQLANG